jgi:hypothetical protein
MLTEGNKSGVLTGGLSSEFEEEVIRERWKLIKKKNEVKDPPMHCRNI